MLGDDTVETLRPCDAGDAASIGSHPAAQTISSPQQECHDGRAARARRASGERALPAAICQHLHRSSTIVKRPMAIVKRPLTHWVTDLPSILPAEA